MRKKSFPDIIPLLKHLCIALQPFANSRQIKLNFTTTIKKICFDYQASEVICGFSKLICSIMSYMPACNTLDVTTEVIEKDNSRQLMVKLRNTGINLKRISALTNKCNISVRLYSSATNETVFFVSYSLSSEPDNSVMQEPIKKTSPSYPEQFIELRRRLQLDFTKWNNPVARLSETQPKEAAFLTRINRCILQNMDNEKFDANALSIEMNLSRSQLLRRLKSLISVSPGSYIKSMRLEKAKELLQTSELSVREVAYKTGFNSPSHFTNIFIRKYGILPSLLRRPKFNVI